MKQYLLRYLITLFSMVTFIAVLGVGGAFYIFYQYGRGLPDYKHLANYEPPVVTRMYANDGRLFAEYAHEKRVFIPIEAMPQRIIKTFLAAEDKNFYEHFGIDIPSILRSVVMNVKRMQNNQRPVGASTITQQVARNFLLADIAKEISFTRKIKEAIIAFRLEHTFTKDHILELYLNEIFLGNNSYGVGAAALNYFNKTLDQLTIAEAAFLAGLPKAPSRYHPLRHPQLAKARRDWVIRRMVEDAIITPEQGIEATKEPIVLRKRDEAEVVHADYFAEEIRRMLLRDYGEQTLYQGGLTVRTTVDPKMQALAEKSLREGLIDYDRKHGWRGPIANLNLIEDWISQLNQVPAPEGMRSWRLAVVLNPQNPEATIGFVNGQTGKIPLSELKWARKYITAEARGPEIKSTKMVLHKGDIILVSPLEDKEKKGLYSLCQIPKVSGGMVVMDIHTGRVLAMQGGFDFRMSQYNRVTQALRQPGSAFKPFVYLTALEQGLTPSTTIMDAPFAINMGYGLGVWAPRNYTGKYNGPTTLRMALEKSLNSVTVRMTHERVGMKNVIETSKRFGIVDNMPLQLAMVLGAGETTLLRLTTAYASVVNSGKQVVPMLIDRVQDRKGKTIKMRDPRSCIGCEQQPWLNQALPELIDESKHLTDPTTAYQLVSILQGAVERGTARSVRRILGGDRPVGGKTGTTNDFFDAWFIGFTPDIIVGAYLGFDEPKTLGAKQTGGVIVAPMVANFLKEALKDQPAVPFRVPPGIKLVRVDYASGARTKGEGDRVITEAFKVDAEVPRSQNYVRAGGNDDRKGGGGSSAPSAPNLSGTGGVY